MTLQGLRILTWGTIATAVTSALLLAAHERAPRPAAPGTPKRLAAAPSAEPVALRAATPTTQAPAPTRLR